MHRERPRQINLTRQERQGRLRAALFDICILSPMTPTFFLRIGGFLSLGIGLWGIIDIDGIGPRLWFDVTENVVHTAFGILLLAGGFLRPLRRFRSPITWFTGTVSLLVGIAGLFVASDAPPNFLGITNLEHPIDNMLHITFGIWALACAWVGEGKEKIS